MFKKIVITGLDKESIAKSNNFEAAYSVHINLSRQPEYKWNEIFNDVFDNAWYNMKRETNLIGDKLLLVFADSDNMQGHIDFLKQVVEQTNVRYERYLQEVEMENRRIEEIRRNEEENKNKIKSNLDNLKF